MRDKPRRYAQPRTIWLDQPVPLAPNSSVKVHGVMADAPSRLISHWLELAREHAERAPIEHDSLYSEQSQAG